MSESHEMHDNLEESVKEINDLREQLTAMTERDRVRHEDYQQACGMIAAMHRAAMGVTCGPSRGVVEDVEDLRTAVTAGQQEIARLRDANAGPQCHCPCCAKTWLPKWQVQLQQIT